MEINSFLEDARDKVVQAVQPPVAPMHNAELNSAEIGNLWDTYMHYSMLKQVCRYFEKVILDINDTEVISLISYCLKSFNTRLMWIEDTFKKENLRIPQGFSDNDVNINAPQLYSDTYYLHYLRNMIRLGLMVHSLNISMAARPDVRDFYKEVITTILELNKKTTNLMLARGILSKHPSIHVPNDIEIARTASFLAGYIGKRQPLLAREIAHLYNIALLNFVGQVLLTGFSQVAKSDKVRNYMKKGIRIANDVIGTATSILKEDNIPTPLPGDAFTRDSKAAPFSDKLMMFHTMLLNNSGMSMYGSAVGFSYRHDITQKYALILTSGRSFAEEGIKIMIENGWMEEPPQKYESAVAAKH